MCKAGHKHSHTPLSENALTLYDVCSRQATATSPDCLNGVTFVKELTSQLPDAFAESSEIHRQVEYECMHAFRFHVLQSRHNIVMSRMRKIVEADVANGIRQHVCCSNAI